MIGYWLAAAASFVFAAFVAVTGGIRGTYLGIPFSARRTVPICIVAWLFVLLAARTSDPGRLDDRIARCIRRSSFSRRVRCWPPRFEGMRFTV
jgi:hypothetical protein